jgi:uncharacterized membrane protein
LEAFFANKKGGQITRLKTFSNFKSKLADPEKVEKYQRFMPGADERIVAMMEKEQEHQHRLEKTQMETWARLSLVWLIPSIEFKLPDIYIGVLQEISSNSQRF